MGSGVGQGRPHCEIFSPLPFFSPITHNFIDLPEPYFRFSVFLLNTVCNFLSHDVTSRPHPAHAQPIFSSLPR